MIIHNVWRRLNASEPAASHCVVGIDWTAPRAISETFAITGSASPSVAFVQSGIGIVTPRTLTWNGSSEICAKPRKRPVTVAIAIAMKLIARLKTKPRARGGVHFHSVSRIDGD